MDWEDLSAYDEEDEEEKAEPKKLRMTIAVQVLKM
jgi:hypothetical protein